MPVTLSLGSDGQYRVVPRWRTKLYRLWRKITSPIRRRIVVTEVDYAAGTITVTADNKWYRFL